MKKKMHVLVVAALVVALLALSGVAQSAMWVGAEIGGNFNKATIDASVGPFSASTDVFIRPSVIGGVTLGYDFINSGFGGANYPSWMQYFSIALDFTYNRLAVNGIGGNNVSVLAPNSRLNGWQAAWTLLFMAHYGFLRDSEVPTGRINPYIGVGPALSLTGVEGTLNVVNPPGTNPRFHPRFGDSQANVALVVEPGIRWMCFKNVSVDTAFRYRYSVPSWSGNNASLDLNLHQFTFLLRANYHF